MLVACLTSLVALNGKNHAGTGNSAAFTVTQPLERAQNDAFGHPNINRIKNLRFNIYAVRGLRPSLRARRYTVETVLERTRYGNPEKACDADPTFTSTL